jgi:SAM-dependent methyltransferase
MKGLRHPRFTGPSALVALEAHGQGSISTMGFYSRCIFPFVLDWAMSRPELGEQRPHVVSAARGDVLEIGFATGLNIEHYGPIERLTALEPNRGMGRRAGGRIARAPFPVDVLHLAAGGTLPLDANRFDTIVSTWTMCSIANIDAALEDLRRLLKPGGRLLFVEHGLSPDPAVAKWQHRLTPITKAIGGGCHMNRDHATLIERHGFGLARCDRFYVHGTPRVGGYTYRGVALAS